MEFNRKDKMLIIGIMALITVFICVVLFGENLLICKMLGEEYATIENGVCVVVQ